MHGVSSALDHGSDPYSIYMSDVTPTALKRMKRCFTGRDLRPVMIAHPFFSLKHRDSQAPLIRLVVCRFLPGAYSATSHKPKSYLTARNLLSTPVCLFVGGTDAVITPA